MTPGRDHYREVQESMIEVVLTRKEAIPRLRGKKDFEYGPTSEKKAMKTEAEMDGLSTET